MVAVTSLGASAAALGGLRAVQPLLTLYVVGLLTGVFSVCFGAAYQASFPRLVRHDQLA